MFVLQAQLVSDVDSVEWLMREKTYHPWIFIRYYDVKSCIRSIRVYSGQKCILRGLQILSGKKRVHRYNKSSRQAVLSSVKKCASRSNNSQNSSSSTLLKTVHLSAHDFFFVQASIIARGIAMRWRFSINICYLLTGRSCKGNKQASETLNLLRNTAGRNSCASGTKKDWIH